MKKIISLILAILAFSLCFASCDTSDNDSSAATGLGDGTASLTNGSNAGKPTSTGSTIITGNNGGISSSTDSGTSAPTTTTAPKLEEIDFSKLETLDGVNESASETDYVMIKIRDYGDIVVRLYPNVAPKTVANFKKLVGEKFYDGLIFHRVIKGFMIQGGDPTGTGFGGSNATVEGEFSSNGFENNLIHKKGVISMARSSSPNSASSQFFICHKTKSHLDGDYASFGFVVYGLDVVDAVAAVSTNSDDKPLNDVVIESIRFVSIPE